MKKQNKNVLISLIVIAALFVILYFTIGTQQSFYTQIESTSTSLASDNIPNYIEINHAWIGQRDGEVKRDATTSICTFSNLEVPDMASQSSAFAVSDEVYNFVKPHFGEQNPIKSVKFGTGATTPISINGWCSVSDGGQFNGNVHHLSAFCTFGGQIQCSPVDPHIQYDGYIAKDGVITFRVLGQTITPTGNVVTQECSAYLNCPNNGVCDNGVCITQTSTTPEVTKEPLQCVDNVGCISVCGDKTPTCVENQCQCNGQIVLIEKNKINIPFIVLGISAFGVILTFAVLLIKRRKR